MKKVICGLFIGLFLCMSLALSVGMVFAGPAEPAANEILAEAPALKNGDGSLNGEFLSQAAEWVNDRFFLRNELIGLDRRLTASVLDTSGQSSVILGSDGWLYFAPTLPDYTGTEGMTDRELRSAAHNLSLMARYCAENGKQFLFAIAPNKNALYSANMPSFGVKAEVTDAEKLHSLLDEEGVAYADLFAAFEARDEVLYFAHDSHWNSKGAALGADTINAAFGRESSYFTADFTATQPHEGDLFAMLYPGSTGKLIRYTAVSWSLHSPAEPPRPMPSCWKRRGGEAVSCWPTATPSAICSTPIWQTALKRPPSPAPPPTI